MALQLQIEAKRKMLGSSVAFGVKSVEKHLIRRNFFELTTPIAYTKIFLALLLVMRLGAIKYCENFSEKRSTSLFS